MWRISDVSMVFDLGHVFSLRNANSPTSAWIPAEQGMNGSPTTSTQPAPRAPPQLAFAPLHSPLFTSGLEEGMKPPLLLGAALRGPRITESGSQPDARR